MQRSTIYEIRIIPGRTSTAVHLLEVAWSPKGAPNSLLVRGFQCPDPLVPDAVQRMTEHAVRGVEQWRRFLSAEEALPGI